MKAFIRYVTITAIVMAISMQFVFAQIDSVIQDDGDVVYQQETQLVDKCFNGFTDSECGATSSCSVDIEYPNGSMLYAGKTMTNYGSDSLYNITIPATVPVGEYFKVTTCTEGGKSWAVKSTFEVIYDNLSNSSYALFSNLVFLFIKIGFFIFLLWLCVRGIKASKEKETTPYFFIALLRVFWTSASYVVIFLSPLIALFLFHPNFSIGVLQRLTLNTYIVLLALATPVILFNLFFFGSSILMKLGGFDMEAKKTNQVLNDLDRFSAKGERFKNLIKNGFFRRN